MMDTAGEAGRGRGLQSGRVCQGNLPILHVCRDLGHNESLIDGIFITFVEGVAEPPTSHAGGGSVHDGNL